MKQLEIINKQGIRTVVEVEVVDSICISAKEIRTATPEDLQQLPFDSYFGDNVLIPA